MADGELTHHFREQIVQVAAGSYILEIGLVTFLGCGKVEPVIVGIVEEIAFNAPDFVIHLLPIQFRIYAHFDVRSFERALATGWSRRRGSGDSAWPVAMGLGALMYRFSPSWHSICSP